MNNFNARERQLIEEIWNILPPAAIQSESLALDIHIHPLSFLPSYCELSRLYELYGFSQFEAIPLRKSLIQSHVRIDTVIMYSHILRITRQEADSFPDTKFEVWSRLVNLESKAFRSRGGLHFDGSICTDGVSVSVYLKHPDAPPYASKSTKKSKEAIEAEVKQMYVDNNLPLLRHSSNIVVIDPNKRDLLYCQDRNNASVLKYTSNQRGVESGTRLYCKIRERMKSAARVNIMESNIRSHKTMDVNLFLHYLLSRAAVSIFRQPFYDQPEHRKLRWKRFINTQKSEQNFINQMKKSFGTNFAVVLGDWSDGGSTMKFQSASKTKGWRTTFKRNKVKLL